jgi:hypothetical protein
VSDPSRIDNQFSDIINAAIGVNEDIIPSSVAARLLAQLRTEDPELLAAWLDQHAEAIVRDAITSIIRQRRSRARKHAAAGAFGKAAREFTQTGDVSVLSPFSVRYVVDGLDTQRQVRDMNRTDCLFVAERYSISADRALMQAAFHKAVADRLGDRTVGEVFSEEQYNRMYRSLVNRGGAVNDVSA